MTKPEFDKRLEEFKKELNLKSENILKCCKGDRIHCGGFKWRYYD